MTRLNSTFRSGCKVYNRTIKEEKQAEQAYRLRKSSRSISKQSQVILYFDKTLIRTGRLFGTRLHERSTRTKSTSEIKVRGMDVARQSNMEEGLQVKLLPWKDKHGKLNAEKVDEYKPCEDNSILHRVSGDFCRNGTNEKHQEQHRSRRKPKECVEQLNGEGKIEDGVKTDNRTNLNALSVKETLEHKDIDNLSEELNVDSGKVSSKNYKEILPVRVKKNGDWNGHLLNNKKRTKPSAANHCGYEKSISRQDERTFESRPSVLNLTPDTIHSKCDIDCEKIEELKTKNASFSNLPKNGQCSFEKLNTLHMDNHSLRFAASQLVHIDALVENFEKKFIYSSPVSTFKNTEAGVLQKKVEAETCNCSTMLTEEQLERKCLCGELVKDNNIGVQENLLEKRPKRTNRSLKRNNDYDYVTEMKPVKRKKMEKNDLVRGNSKKVSKSSSTRGKQRCIVSNKKSGALSKSDDFVSCEKEDENSNENKYVNVEYVLGVRHSDSSSPQVLVQFMDETSNWIGLSEMDAPLSSVSEYFSCPNQDLSILHRLPSSWFEKFASSWKPRKPQPSDFVDNEICDNNKGNLKSDRATLCKEVDMKNISLFQHMNPRHYSAEKVNLDEQLGESPVIDESLLDEEFKEKMKYKLSIVCDEENLKRDLSKNCLLRHVDSDDDPDHDYDDKHFPHDIPDELQCRSAEKANPVDIKSLKEYISDAATVFVSRNGELEVLESDHVEIILKHKDKRSKRIRSETCDNLIQQLEERIRDEKCKLVVISGLEDYFSSTMDMEKLIKFPAESEKTRYDEKMANLRYLFQTLKHYPKPIIANINSAATGLAAALLSLVDIVYDQSQELTKKNGLCITKPHLPVLAPKLMGLHHKNEALLMGELPDTRLEEQLKQVNNIFRSCKFSDDITSTLKEMRNNEELSFERPSPKKRGRIPSSNKTSPAMPLDVRHNKYVKTRLARLKFPATAEQECFETVLDNELQEAIDKEQELASKCLEDLAEFWKEMADSACS